MQELIRSLAAQALLWAVTAYFLVYIPCVLGAAAYSIAVRIEWHRAYRDHRCMATWSRAHPMTWRFCGMNYSPYRPYKRSTDYEQIALCIFDPVENSKLCVNAWAAVREYRATQLASALKA